MRIKRIPSFLAGTATGLTIGGAEMFGYVFLTAATSRASIEQRRSWWRWEERFVRVQSLRDLRLTPEEGAALAIGLVLILMAAYLES